jgi:3-keto-5-aminohexanoate cleavage enzyme
MSDAAILTCAMNGVLTDPARFSIPVTGAQMAAAAREAWDAGATVVHCHFRMQEEGMGRLPTWDPAVVAELVAAIRAEVPDILINMSTGVMDDDTSGPEACLEACRPEIAALNCGSLNYLKTRRDGSWAWPPMLFSNPVPKIERMAKAMAAVGAVPECECFDTGIIRSIGMLRSTGILTGPLHCSLVMGVASGMPAKAEWLPLLRAELPEEAHWQVIAIGRQEVWELHRACAEQGGHVRTGLEDTFYLPDGSKAASNGPLIEAAAAVIERSGRHVASIEETRALFGMAS